MVFECISSMRGITYEEVHAPDAKTTSQGEFFFLLSLCTAKETRALVEYCAKYRNKMTYGDDLRRGESNC
jgi:hypothetical protein